MSNLYIRIVGKEYSRKNFIIDNLKLSVDLDELKKEKILENESESKEKSEKIKEKSLDFESIFIGYMDSISLHFSMSSYIFKNLHRSGSSKNYREVKTYADENFNTVWTNKDDSLDSIYEVNIRESFYILDTMSKFYKESSKISRLPGLFFSGLISSYDAHFSDLIKYFLKCQPDAVDKSEKTITIDEMMKFSTLDEAKNSILEKQVDNLMRGSHLSQIKWIGEKTKIDLISNINELKDFIEICERRNLFTHTNCIITNQYINVCNVNHISHSFKVGDEARIRYAYYKKSIKIVTSVFFKVIFNLYVNTHKKETDKIFEFFNLQSFYLIKSEEYAIASSILEFLYENLKKFSSILDSTRKMIIINYANSIKLGNDLPKAVKILDSHDWSTATEDYKICIEAIKDNAEYVASKMKIAVDSCEGFNDECLVDWPVFISVRKSEKFISAFKEIFGKTPESYSKYSID